MEKVTATKKMNLFELKNNYLPLIKKGLKWWWLFLGIGIGLGTWYYIKNSAKPVKYTAQISFMLEDDISGQGGGAGATTNPLLMAMAGMSGNNNKLVIIDLSTSNKLIESTLLHKVKIGNKEQFLLDYFIDVFGHRNNWKNDKDLKDFVLKEDYKVGDNPRFDYMLRSYSRGIKEVLATSVQESGIFKMVYASTDENFTKLFMDKHLEVISEFYIMRKIEKSAAIVKLAARKRDSIASLLVGKDYAAASVQDNVFGGVKKSLLVPEMQIKRDIGILTQQYNEIMSILNSSKLEIERRKPFITVIDDIRVPLPFESEKPLAKSILILILIFIVGVGLTLGFYMGKDYLKQQKEDFLKNKTA